MINLQLGDKGLFIRSGEISIIDASVIKAKNNRPNKDKDGGNTQDKEAAYNVKNGSDGKRKPRMDSKPISMPKRMVLLNAMNSPLVMSMTRIFLNRY